MERSYKIVRMVVSILTWTAVIVVWIMASFTVLPRVFGYTPSIVVSGSMEPEIPIGAMVYTKQFERQPIVGDIVTYQATDNMTVLHRIIDYDPATRHYTVKGDNNDTLDGTEFTASQFTGIYQKHIPRIGYVFNHFDDHVFQIGTFAIPAMIPMLIGCIVILNLLEYVFSILVRKQYE